MGRADLRILIADDDRLSLRVLEISLQATGHDVISVANGEEAMQKLQSDESIALLITDWIMPVMDGLDLCRKARALKRNRYLPILLITSKDEKQDLIDALNAGADAFLPKPLNPAELEAHLRVVTRILDLEHELAAHVEHLTQAHARIEVLARTDELTGLPNRRAIMGRLDQEIARVNRYGTDFSVFILDIDHFKQVNDTHGHLVGDQVLRWCAETLSGSLRTIDISGRYGGEEFLGILVETDLQGALAACERIRADIANNSCNVDGCGEIRVTVSIGVTRSCGGSDTLNALVARADEALYSAKETGRNRVCFKPPAGPQL